MEIANKAHLSYCTNIHPGETWPEIFESLKNYTLKVKQAILPKKKFGIGLRLSQKSALVLVKTNNLIEFKNWLELNDLYVFTMNGFPYGEFHNVAIKDQVHTPDWTTQDRVDYTKNLMEILAFLLPDNTEGGVSTSPLSYKYWFNSKENIHQTTEKTCDAIIQIVLQLIEIKQNSGKTLHLDIEPEPDGFLENTAEVINFYISYLFKQGINTLQNILHCSESEAKKHILEHVQVCYDVCHFALAYEKPEFVISSFEKQGIKIGKIQISSAIKCQKSDKFTIKEQQNSLREFDEPTYLHQSIVQLKDNSLVHFSDLSEGIDLMTSPDFKEIRTHFHVPIFTTDFGVLASTQNEIIDALAIWKKNKYTAHLEIETYTWGVLPEHLQTNMTQSISRELTWVLNQLAN